MSKNRPPVPQPAPTVPTPAAVPTPSWDPLTALGVPTKLTVLHPTQIPGSGVAASVFSTADKNRLVMNDYGGFDLRLLDLGVVVSSRATGGRLLVPWSQVTCVEFAP